MAAFDDDVRDMVKVNVIHGFWKQEDPNRLNLMASRFLENWVQQLMS